MDQVLVDIYVSTGMCVLTGLGWSLGPYVGPYVGYVRNTFYLPPISSNRILKDPRLIGL